MQTAIKKIGNSSGIILPKTVLAHLHLAPGDMIDIDLEQGRLVISPAPRIPRAGWEEAARSLAADGDDDAAWPLFANDGDEML